MENFKGGRMISSLAPRCRELRRRMTPAEVALWELLRGRRLEGLKFRRQHQVGSCIVDFYCAEAQFGVEVDGAQHRWPRGIENDAARTAYLEALAATILRCTNAEVIESPATVVARILNAITTR